MLGRVACGFVVLGGLTLAPDASAQTYELRHDVAADVAFTSTAVALLVGSELGKGDLGPRSCRWCDRDGRRDTLNPLDANARASLRWTNPSVASITSDVLAFLVMPTVSFGGLAAASAEAHASGAFPLDALLVAEAVAASVLVNQSVKFAVARERPFAHAGRVAPEGYEGPTPEARSIDPNLSFFSGHTATSFALASATGTVASLRDYRFAPALWATGLSIAAVTGWLRIAADKHYLTDVLVGALLGSALGILVPVVLHPRDGTRGGD